MSNTFITGSNLEIATDRTTIHNDLTVDNLTVNDLLNLPNGLPDATVIKGNLTVDETLTVIDSTSVNGILFKTVGGTPSLLNYYEEYDLITTLNGDSNNVNVTFHITRLGDNVTITWKYVDPATNNFFCASDTALYTNTNLPSRFRPSVGNNARGSCIFCTTVLSRFLVEIGVDSNGRITFQPFVTAAIVQGSLNAVVNGELFPSTSYGMFPGSFTYTIQ